MERAYDLGRILVLRRNSEARVPSVRPAGAASPPRSRSSLQADPRLCLCTRGRHTRPRARSERTHPPTPRLPYTALHANRLTRASEALWTRLKIIGQD